MARALLIVLFTLAMLAPLFSLGGCAHTAEELPVDCANTFDAWECMADRPE